MCVCVLGVRYYINVYLFHKKNSGVSLLSCSGLLRREMISSLKVSCSILGITLFLVIFFLRQPVFLLIFSISFLIYIIVDICNSNNFFTNIFLALFPSFGHLCQMVFLGQWSDPSHSCDLRSSCSNARSLTHCAVPGIEPASQHAQDTANPVVPQGTYFFGILYISKSRNISD